jgi:hypothetical protein
MFDPEFWKFLDQRLTAYSQLVKENVKKVKSTPNNRYRSERQEYEQKLNNFLYLMSVFDKIYQNL